MLLCVAATTASCDDLFRDAPVDKLDEGTIWGKEQLVDEYILPWYRDMDNGFSTFVPTAFSGLGREYETWFSDQLTVGRKEWYNADYGNILKSQQSVITLRSKNLWVTYYTEIGSINRLLANADQLPARIRNRVLGEAYFFRGYYYYQLLRRYGGPLLIDHVFDPLVKAEKFPRASYDEMVRFIAADADRAAALLEPRNDESNTGRATRGAALMLKGKTFFWAAGAHFQNQELPYLGFPDDRSAAMLDSAAAAYDRVIALNVYDLMPINGSTRDEVVAGYRNIFLTKNSIESIWEVQHSSTGNISLENGHKLDRDAAAPSFGATVAAYNPTQNHVDEYRMANGLPITDPNSGYDAKNPYEGRDYRFYANVLYDGAEWNKHVMEIHYNKVDGKDVVAADLTPYGTSTSASVSRTGYYMAKFLNEKQVIDNNDTYASSQNCIIWRYAELLLDYAEIDFKRGDVQAATDKVNRIRQRVKMPALATVTWADILNERRVELAFEKTIYWDHLRYNEAAKKMTGNTNPLFGIKIVFDTNGKKTITKPVVNGRNTVVRYFRDRQYYLPIAWDDVRYHGVDQNPEWNEM